MKYVALVASPHAAARIVSIDAKAAIAAPGVLYVLTGEESAPNTDSLRIGVDAPEVNALRARRGVVRTPANGWLRSSPDSPARRRGRGGARRGRIRAACRT